MWMKHIRECGSSGGKKTGGTDSKDFVQENDLPKYPGDVMSQGSQSGAQYKQRIYPQAFTCGNQSLREKV